VYKLMSSLSILVRGLLLPNPFDSMKWGVLINWGVGIILAPFTYGIVGLFYEGGSAPAWGSFLYLFFYSMHTALILLCGTFDFKPIAIVTIVVLYAVMLNAIGCIRNRFR